MFSKLKHLTEKDLLRLLESLGLSDRVLETCKRENIAGRHLARLSTASDLSRFGFSLGDIFDIEDAIINCDSFEFQEKDQQNTRSELISTPPPKSSNLSSGDGNNSASTSKTPTIGNESQSNSNSIFDGFATRDQVAKMTPYHKDVNIQRITTYWEMKANGLTLKKPYMDLNDSPEKKTKSPEKEIGCALSSDESSPPRKRKAPGKENELVSSSDESTPPRTSKARGRENKCESSSHESSPPKRRKSTSCLKEKVADESNKMKKTEGESSKKKKHSLRSKSKDKTPKQKILACHEEFLNSDYLDKTQKAYIKHYLESPVNQSYNILEILGDREDVADEMELLVRDGVVFQKDLSAILQALVQYLYTLVRNPNLMSPDMREGMAVSIVASYPKLAQKPVQEGDMPWTWLYNRAKNTGKIANIVQNIQRNQKSKRARGGGSDKRKRGPKSVESVIFIPSVPDSELSKDASFLRLVVDTDTNRPDIESKMKLTFQERRNLIDSQKYHTNALLKAFPKLKSFQGSMIDFEFNLLHDGKEHNFLMNWRDVSKNIIAISRGNKKLETCFHFKDDALNAMCVLTKYLPRPKRVYQWENKMNPEPSIKDFVQVEPVGTNIQNAIETKREMSKFPIQPYLLAIGDTDNIQTWCLVLGDSHSVGLPPSTEPTRAVDLLLKSFYVLNVHFPLAWKHAFRFVFSHVYGIPPENDKLSVFTQEWLEINKIL